jgi:hypothetical protein
MVSLLRTLQDSEPALLPVLASVWGVKIDPKDRERAAKLLAEAMLTPAHAERIWDTLNDGQRGALQLLISNKGKMPETMFTRLFGEIRRMGAGQIERERPLEQPAGTAEALFYRGLIGIAYETTNAGPRGILHIPEDLLAVLPIHKTAYDNLEEVDDDFPEEEMDEDTTVGIILIDKPDNAHPADTSVVDDMTTLLAYIQLNSPAVESDSVADVDALMAHLLTRDAGRLVFLIGLAASAGFIESQSARLYIKRPEVRRWLEHPRHEQVRTLAEAWRGSTVWHDLWHVPGLYVEREAGTMPQYNPAAARQEAIDLLESAAPREGWWSQDSFIDLMKSHDRDFQRPNGDYQSWYIRNDAGEYLTGEESWDAVEGALLHYYLNGPLHWLGLFDVADGASRLSAYGRAFIARKGWPTPPDTPDKIVIKDDGTLLVPRKAPRIDRFQVARFAVWISAGDPYTYRLQGDSIAAAAEQGISVSHIAAFLNKANNDAPLPAAIQRLLENWRGGATAAVTFERLLVLRTTASETLDFIFDTPALRRYLGARLGPMAVVIRADQWGALQTALGEHSIQVELIGLP